jgi:predicted enzyme related to lactoylglutathione lyase
MKVDFKGGVNIAIKIPKAKYEKTVEFYRDTLQLEVQEKPITHPTISRTHEVKFGPNRMWLDCVDNYTHNEAWFEIITNDVEQATQYLKAKGVETCDEIEEIPKTMHWITDPAGNVFILTAGD